ncbi:MAG: Rrf2 family transcriptional regulator [Planctomycetota bacterium]
MATLAQGTGYAIQALSCIAAAAGKPQLVREIAESCDLPAPYLSKIIHKLARAGMVHTQRGINGGVSLVPNATDISLLDVCEALEDPVMDQRCLLGISQCSDERACPAHAFNMQQRKAFVDFIATTTIADIAAFEMQRRWRVFAAPTHVQPVTNGHGRTGTNGSRGHNGHGASPDPTP